MKKTSLLLTVLALFIAAAPMHAQGPGGCANSPENPTVILALVGSAGGLFVSARARLNSRRK